MFCGASFHPSPFFLRVMSRNVNKLLVCKKNAKEAYFSMLGYSHIIALSGNRIEIGTGCKHVTQTRAAIKNVHFETPSGRRSTETYLATFVNICVKNLKSELPREYYKSENMLFGNKATQSPFANFKSLIPAPKKHQVFCLGFGLMQRSRTLLRIFNWRLHHVKPDSILSLTQITVRSDERLSVFLSKAVKRQ